MTIKKLRSLLVQIKLGVVIEESVEDRLRDYAVNILESAKAPTIKKMIAWWMDESTVVDEISDAIAQTWNMPDVAFFIRKWDSKLKKHGASKIVSSYKKGRENH